MTRTDRPSTDRGRPPASHKGLPAGNFNAGGELYFSSRGRDHDALAARTGAPRTTQGQRTNHHRNSQLGDRVETTLRTHSCTNPRISIAELWPAPRERGRTNAHQKYKNESQESCRRLCCPTPLASTPSRGRTDRRSTRCATPPQGAPRVPLPHSTPRPLPVWRRNRIRGGDRPPSDSSLHRFCGPACRPRRACADSQGC